MRLREFAPAGGGGSGDYFQALASAWYNGTFDTGSLQKGIKSQQDVERLLNRGIVCPDGKTRKLHIDYNSDFDGVEIYSDDYYEHGDESGELDSRTGQPWGPYDFMAFSDEDLSEGLNEFAADDGDSGGEDDALRNYARMWWAGNEATQMQIERALAKMGWEIGEDEGGYDNGGVFVVRAGDENGNSYQSWAAEDLTEGVAEGYEPPTSAKGSPAYRASLLRKKQERQAAADAKKKQQGVAEGHADQQRKVFKKNGEPVGEVGIDRESSPGNGQWYMKCYANGIDNVGYDSYEEAVAELKHCLKQGVAEAVWDRPSQSYVPRDGRTFGQTNHPREEHCDACGAATGHAGPGEDSNVDDEGNVYCDDCYADQKGVAEGEDKYAELSKKIQDLAQAGKEGEANKLRYELNRLLMLDRDKKRRQERGVAEGSDSCGPQGRFVGDTGPTQVSTTVPRVQLRIGDRVVYKPTEQRATIEALSKDGTKARIHIPSPMGGKIFNCQVADLKALGALKEKSTSQAQFRTMAAAAHDPKFARKVGIKQSVAKEFNRADKGQSYKSLPKKAD